MASAASSPSVFDLGEREAWEFYGRLYAERRLTIIWTDGKSGESAKRCSAKRWNEAEPLCDSEYAAALFAGHGWARNPAVVLGPPSGGLIGIDIDGELGATLAREFELPQTWTVVTANGRHLWYWPPEGCPDGLVKVQLAHSVTSARAGYLVIPPAKNGSHVYRFDPGPWELEIAELPLVTAEALFTAARYTRRQRIAVCDAEVLAGERHEHLRHLAYVMRRYAGASLPALEAALVAENESRCVPPKSGSHCRALARDTVERIRPKAVDDA